MTVMKLHVDCYHAFSARDRHDDVALAQLRSVEMQLMYACADVGIIFVPLNIRWSLDELHDAVVDSGVNVVAILHSSFHHVAMKLAARLPSISHFLVSPIALHDIPEAFNHQVENHKRWRRFAIGAKCNSTEDIAAVTHVGGDHLDEDPDSVQKGSWRDASDDDAADDVFCIIYTSGTTGCSKGVALQHLGQVINQNTFLRYC